MHSCLKVFLLLPCLGYAVAGDGILVRVRYSNGTQGQGVIANASAILGFPGAEIMSSAVVDVATLKSLDVSSDSSSGGLSTGAILLIVCGVLAGVIVLGLVIWDMLRNRNAKNLVHPEERERLLHDPSTSPWSQPATQPGPYGPYAPSAPPLPTGPPVPQPYGSYGQPSGQPAPIQPAPPGPYGQYQPSAPPLPQPQPNAPPFSQPQPNAPPFPQPQPTAPPYPGWAGRASADTRVSSRQSTGRVIRVDLVRFVPGSD